MTGSTNDTAEAALAAFWDRESDEPTYWEPWKPKVGDRVEVRVSGECGWRGDPGSAAEQRGEGHPAWMDGKTGEVVEIDPTPGAAAVGHRYLIDWDVPHVEGWRTFVGSAYAAAELLPLAPATDDDDGEGDRG